MDSNVRTVPVFVFPHTLKFYLGSRQTHKQLLTLYNPYDFAVRFKVLSTAPNKYSVIDPDGSIGPQACVDIVIRHTMPMSSNCNVIDKFRISMLDHTTKKGIGKRDIEAKLVSGEAPGDSNSNDGGDFHSLPQGEQPVDNQRNVQYPINNYRSLSQNSSINYIPLLMIAVCSIALVWPTQQEVQAESFIPSYLHITPTIKLVVAYVLGLLTMVVLKPLP